MRNSGFVVSTTLIKLYLTDGLASHLLVIMSVVFGTLMLVIYKRYRNIELPRIIYFVSYKSKYLMNNAFKPFYYKYSIILFCEHINLYIFAGSLLI